MKEEERLKLENELLLNKSKAQMINLYLDKLQELDQYKNNWEELKKMFEADEHFEDGCYCGEIFNKMKELEENK